MRVFVYGAGKVGTALARAVRAAGGKSELLSARKGMPRKRVDADMLVLAVREKDLPRIVEAFCDGSRLARRTACVHVAGSLDADVLAPLRPYCAGVAQMHPMIAFADVGRPPRLEGGHVHVQGDEEAVRRARRLARSLGMIPRTFPGLDPVGYHAAAGLLANGAAALAALAAEVLVQAGVPREIAPAMLGPLLGSVARNVDALGFPQALTGPVRRGDARAVAKHLAILRERVPAAIPLFVAGARAQLPLARALGEADSQAFDAIEAVLDEAREGSG